MSLPRSLLAKSVDGALRMRKRAGYQASEPVCVFDLADKLGVEVRFVGGNSFGGMYVKDFERILVPSKRPPGRQAFTCGHELGHRFFGHGTRVELIELLDKGGDDDPDEKAANVFASNLIMPKWAVEDAFRRRELLPDTASSVEYYSIANQLGIGYETLIKHLRFGLGAISDTAADRLLRISPKEIREQIIGTTAPRHLVLVDQSWWRVPIDLSVGDAVRLPVDVGVEGSMLRIIGPCAGGVWAEAVAPGIGRVFSTDPSWASFVRVARRGYEGRSKYRFLEDPDVDESA